MVITRIVGGLGNQMFQYAAGKSLAKKLNTPLKLDITDFKKYTLRQYELDCFVLKPHFASAKELFIPRAYYRFPLNHFSHSWRRKIIRNLSQTDYLRDPYNQGLTEFSQLEGNVYLDGFWNSELFFKNTTPEVRRDFCFKLSPSAQMTKLIQMIQETTAISLHVRRTDYITAPKNKAIFGTCSVEYYLQAMKLIEANVSNPTYFVFSDDKPWAKANIKSQHHLIFIDHREADFEDLRLMSLCRHHIVANSTFSWWGAWLHNDDSKIVVAPRCWFKALYVNNRDICPMSWKRI